MNFSKLVIIGFFALVIFAIPILIVGAAIAANGADNQGESLKQVASEVSGTTDSGTLSDDVPAILASVFKEAGGAVGTPASVIAAISYQECNRLWSHARNHPDIVQIWIEKNLDVDSNGCGAVNSYNVAGPMQFQGPTFASYAAETSKLTGHSPASRLNVRDAIFAAALKLRADSGVLKKTNGELPQASDWTEQNVRSAAKHYFGKCVAPAYSVTVYYCDDIVRRWKQYSNL